MKKWSPWLSACLLAFGLSSLWLITVVALSGLKDWWIVAKEYVALFMAFTLITRFLGSVVSGRSPWPTVKLLLGLLVTGGVIQLIFTAIHGR